ncbi:DNA replication complex GINS protein psf3-like [Rosa rugosa]|uniref:DNA replication complex GINS protein psf3-like n=1 Tax=Rosa rugosa TaxID=74645 RepID=UPI002B4136CE|nr:DNA replication complex GINS protein psf3-like [Rosa rugosa]
MGNYYDIDDILAEEELVSVVFQKGANGVGIDPSAEAYSVEPGSRVKLPFWLAYELHARQVVTMKLPACFNQQTRLELGADGKAVDLRSRCLYFYEFGCKIAPLVGDRDMGSFLLSAFRNRYQEVLAKAHSAAYTAASKLLTLLTKEEINLYEAAQSSMAAFKKWRMGGPRLQRASVLGRKRKSTD